MGDPSGYWTWDEISQDYYHDQPGVRNRIWARNTPRTATQENPPAHLGPLYNPVGNYGPVRSSLPPATGRYSYNVYNIPSGVEGITAGLARLPGTLDPPQQTDPWGPRQAYVDSRGTEQRPAAIGGYPRTSAAQEGGQYPLRRASISANPSRVTSRSTIAAPPGYGPSRRFSENQPPPARPQPSPYGRYSDGNQRSYDPAASGLTRAVGKLPARSVEPDDSWSGQDPSSEYDDEQLSREIEYSRATYARETYTSGASKEARASSASYSGPKASLASMMPQQGLANNESSLAFYRPSHLDPSQFKRVDKPHKFFVVGKVIKVFYIANAGEPFPDRDSVRGNDFTTVALGEVAHHTIRRFVIVGTWTNENFCFGLPITTYNGRGTTKPGVNQGTHTIIYTGTNPPPRLQREGKMKKDALQMIEFSPDEKLDTYSRLNLRKHHVIEYNWKVKEIGRISDRSLPKLIAYWKASRENMK